MGFSILSAQLPVVEGLIYGLVALGVPLSHDSMLSMRLLFEQTMLYAIMVKLMAARHEFFSGRRWVRWSLRGAWLAPVLGGYAASVALFNLVEPFNQALLSHLAYAPEGMVAKLANPADGRASSLVVASLVPCVGAPLFEELQSRAFILQVATRAVSPRAAARRVC